MDKHRLNALNLRQIQKMSLRYYLLTTYEHLQDYRETYLFILIFLNIETPWTKKSTWECCSLIYANHWPFGPCWTCEVQVHSMITFMNVQLPTLEKMTKIQRALYSFHAPSRTFKNDISEF